MLTSFLGLASALVDHTVGNVLRLSHRTMESFLLWQYGLELEGGRNKIHQQRVQQISSSSATLTTDSSSDDIPQFSTPEDVDVCHRQAVAGLTLLAQRVPRLMGGYYRPTLQSIYGSPFTSLAALKKQREEIVKNVWFYRLITRGLTTTSTNDSTRTSTIVSDHDERDADDIPVVVWLVMPWESESPDIIRFVLRLAQSLGCNALFVTVPMDGERGPAAPISSLNAMIANSRQKLQAGRILIGGCDLAAMFVLLLLDRYCRLLHVGALAGADSETARRSFCHGVFLVDPFVGWETCAPVYGASGNGISNNNNNNNNTNPTSPFYRENPYFDYGNRANAHYQQQGQQSAKDRFKQVVMSSSGGYIREWFPPPITYETPPVVVLVDKGGFWLQEQCEFNARVNRLSMEGSEEKVFFLPYSIETTAAGTMVSRDTSVGLDRIWRMVEKFLSEQLSHGEAHSTAALSLPSSSGRGVRRRKRRERRGSTIGATTQPRLREGEATFLAAYVP